MNTCQMSLCASAVRVNLWNDFANSLKNNKINYEIIFVGNVEPVIHLVENKITWIYSETKPAQCYEIAFRLAKGELIHWTADEAVYDYGALDCIYKYYRSFNRKDLITGFTVYENNGESYSLTSDGHYLVDRESHRMACFGVISNQYFKELGGYDKRFITGQAENDVCMRNYERGGMLNICPDAKVSVYHNKAHNDNNSSFRKWYMGSRGFLDSCWIKPDKSISNKRLIPFEPFREENIYIESQEPKGEW